MSRFVSFLFALALVLQPMSGVRAFGSFFESFPESLTVGLVMTALSLALAACLALGQKQQKVPGEASLILPYTGFFATVLLIMGLRLMVEAQPLDVVAGASFDLVAYAIVLLAICALQVSIRACVLQTFWVVRYTLVLYLLVYTAPLLAFFVVGPVPLLTSDGVVFAPLARNLHHASLTAQGIYALAAICLVFRIPVLGRPMLYVAMAVAMAVAIMTNSSKAIATIPLFLVGVPLLAFLARSSTADGRSVDLLRLVSIGYALLIGALVMATLMGVDVAGEASQRFAEVDYQQGRSQIYSVALETVMQRPLFGYGPGPHVWISGSWQDAHATLLTFLLQTGLVGCALITFLFLRWLWLHPANLAILIHLLAFSFYILFADILRSLPFWLTLMLANDLALRFSARALASPQRAKEQAQYSRRFGQWGPVYSARGIGA